MMALLLVALLVALLLIGMVINIDLEIKAWNRLATEEPPMNKPLPFRKTYRLADSPRVLCLDVPEDGSERIDFAWRLTNVAWEEMYEDLVERGEKLNRDGFHTLLLHCLAQMEEDGIEEIMNDVAHQMRYG